MKKKLTKCSETLAHKIHTPEKNTKERIHHYTCRKVRTISDFEYASLTLMIRYYDTFHILWIN